METKENYLLNKLNKKRIWALITVFVIIANMFSPYSVLMNKSYATGPVAGEPYYVLTLEQPYTNQAQIDTVYQVSDHPATYYYYWDYMKGNASSIAENNTRAVVVNLSISGSNTVNSAEINLTYDTSKLIPAYEKMTMIPGGRGQPPTYVYTMEEATQYSDFATTGWSSGDYEILYPTTGEITLVGSVSASDISSGKKYIRDGEVVGSFVFLLADGVSISDIDTSTFGIKSSGLVKKGLTIPYFDSTGKVQYSVSGEKYLTYDGFATSSTKVQSILLKTAPSKMLYYNEETLDLSDGVVTVTYEDSSQPSEDYTIAELIQKGATISSTTANNTNKTVTLTYEGETLDIEYYVLYKIATTTAPEKIEYEHGDPIDLHAGRITAYYKNADNEEATQVLRMRDNLNTSEFPDRELFADKETADVDNQTLNLTYHGFTAQVELVVTDPIQYISLTTQPAKTEYTDGETLVLSDGEITAHTKSGKTRVISMAESTVGYLVGKDEETTDKADIAACSFKWSKQDGTGMAGQLPIVVVYHGDDPENDLDLRANLTVVVNDVVESIKITRQPTATNLVGITEQQINFTGLQAEVTTSGGGTFYVDVDSLTIDTSSFNPNSLEKQYFDVYYGNIGEEITGEEPGDDEDWEPPSGEGDRIIKSTNQAEIQLENYVTGIEVNFEEDEFDIDTPIATVINKAKYREIYKVELSEEDREWKSITSDMVIGYKQKPAASLFDENHQYKETLTIRKDTFIDTQEITLNDKIQGISVKYTPTKMKYEYNDSFSTSGGYINLNYVSGEAEEISMGATGVSILDNGTAVGVLAPNSTEFIAGNGSVTKNFTITYQTYQTQLNNVIVNDILKDIREPKDYTNVFEWGDTFTTGTGTFTAEYESGAIYDNVSLSKLTFPVNKLEPDYDEGTITKDVSVTGSLKVGNVTKSLNYDVTVNNTISSVVIDENDTAPQSSFKLNEPADHTTIGGSIVVTRKNGAEKSVKISDDSVGILNLDTSSSNTGAYMTIYCIGELGSAAGVPYYYTVTEEKAVDHVEIQLPTTNKFNHDDTTSFQSALQEGKVYIYYVGDAAGTPGKTENITASMLKDEEGNPIDLDTILHYTDAQYGNEHKKEVTLKIEYEGESKNYPITVINDIKTIRYLEGYEPKTVYNVGDSFEENTATIEIIRAAMPEGVDSHTLTFAEAASLTGATLTVDSTAFDSSEIDTTGQKIEVIYTENGVPYDLSYTVTIIDEVESIVIDTDTIDTVLNHGTQLDLTNVMVNVKFKSKATPEPIALSLTNYTTDFDKDVLGNYTLDVEYGGQTDSVQLTVRNYVTGITVSPITGTCGADLDTLLGSATYTVHYKVETAQDILDHTYAIDSTTMMSATELATFDTGSTSKQSFGVIYTDADNNPHNADLEITLTNNVTGITINVPNETQREHQYGDALKTSTGKILVHYEYGADKEVEIDATAHATMKDGSEYKTVNMSPATAEFATTDTVTKEIKLSYSEGGKSATQTYNITIKDYNVGIDIDNPTKTTYACNADIETTNGKVYYVTRSGNRKYAADLSTSMLSATKAQATEGTQIVYVTYGGYTNGASFSITVTDEVSGYRIGTLPEQNYRVGENLDLSKGTIIIEKASGDDVPVSMDNKDVEIRDYNPMNPGNNQKVKVYYKGTYVGEFPVNVADYAIGMEITKPTKQTYNLNETPINLAGGSIKLIMASGKPQTAIPMSDGNVSITGFNTSTPGSVKIDVSYTDSTYGKVEGNFNITVVDPIQSVVLTSIPNKTDYNYNENINLTGAVIRITKESGAVETKPVDKNMISAYNPKTLGNQTITVTYEGQNAGEFSVTVNDYVSHLKVVAPKTTEYEYGEFIDLTGATASIIMASGAVQESTEVTSDMISEYDNTQVGKQSISVNYKGLTGAFQVNFVDKVKGIQMENDPNRTTYEYGEGLDVTGATIKVVKSSGTVEIPVTKAMISGYNPQVTGIQVITVTYGGQTTNFKVFVNNKKEEDKKDPEGPNTDTPNGGGTNTGTPGGNNPGGNTPEGNIPNGNTPSSSTSGSTNKKKPSKVNGTNTSSIVTTEENKEDMVQQEKEEDNTSIKEQNKKENKETNTTKPTQTLGVKDKQTEEKDTSKLVAGAIGLAGMLILLILVLNKNNVKIYVEEDGEYKLAGVDKITKDDRKIDVDRCLDGDNYNNKVKVRLNDAISDKLDEKEVEIKHRGETKNYKIKYNNEAFEIVLE